MAKVFISHAREDHKPTDEVRRWLVAEDHEVFLDRDLCNGVEVGKDWQQRINERLRWADAVVCVVTSAFLTSKWCPYEVGYAQARGNRLLPVLAEPGVDHPLVKSTHYADLTEDPAKARAALVAALSRIDAAGGLGWADNRSPFPGLRAFEVEDHRVFFGRHSEVERLAGLLRSPVERAERAVVLVCGPSGCGKSSLVRATPACDGRGARLADAVTDPARRRPGGGVGQATGHRGTAARPGLDSGGRAASAR